MSREQLCWDCKNATGGCPWSRWGEPVEGWKAIKTKIFNGCKDETTDSYLIISCPLFEKEPERKPVVLEGEDISFGKLAKILSVDKSKLSRQGDEDIEKLAKKAGLTVEVKKEYFRHIVVKKIGKGWYKN